MGVALQDLDGVAMGDVVEADTVGCEDLIAHFDAVLFCKTTGIQPEEKMYDSTQTGDKTSYYICTFLNERVNCGHSQYRVITAFLYQITTLFRLPNLFMTCYMLI